MGANQGATFALHAWDNDDDTGDQLENIYDLQGSDKDNLLVGIQRRFGPQLPTGLQENKLQRADRPLPRDSNNRQRLAAPAAPTR